MQRLVSSYTSSLGAMAIVEQRRQIHKGEFNGPDRMIRTRSSHMAVTQWNSNKYGGRFARLREVRSTKRTVSGRQFSKDPQIIQFNMDVWNAQNTLRKKWKARDWEVVEMPYRLAPKVLQKAIPDMYTAPPMPSDPSTGDYSNIRKKVFDREDLQLMLFTDVAAKAARGETVDVAEIVLPYPPLRRVEASANTLDKFL